MKSLTGPKPKEGRSSNGRLLDIVGSASQVVVDGERSLPLKAEGDTSGVIRGGSR